MTTATSLDSRHTDDQTTLDEAVKKRSVEAKQNPSSLSSQHNSSQLSSTNSQSDLPYMAELDCWYQENYLTYCIRLKGQLKYIYREGQLRRCEEAYDNFKWCLSQHLTPKEKAVTNALERRQGKNRKSQINDVWTYKNTENTNESDQTS